MSSRGRGKSRQRLRAERTTHATGALVHVDMTRTYLYSGAFMETMVNPEPIEGMVRLDLHGQWSKHVVDLPRDPVLTMSADSARELGQLLLGAADAADRDAARWKAANP